MLALTACGGDSAETAITPSPPETSSPEASATDQADPDNADDSGIEEVRLPLQPGAVVTMPAQGVTGRVSVDTPVSVALELVECAPVLAGVGVDEDTYESADFVAATGNQACLITLKVTSQANVPTSFSSLFNNSTLLTSEGNEYGLAKAFSDQGIANLRGVPTAAYAYALQPGGVGYDFSIYEFPASATPQAVVYRIYNNAAFSMPEPSPSTETFPSDTGGDPVTSQAVQDEWAEEWSTLPQVDREFLCTLFNANPDGFWESYMESEEQLVSKTFFMDFFGSNC